MVRFFLFYVAITATIIIHLLVKTSANVSCEFRKQLYDDSLLQLWRTGACSLTLKGEEEQIDCKLVCL